MVAATNDVGAPTRAEFHEAISRRSDCWYAACLKITRNSALAEDAVQDALLSAWDKRHQFQRTSRLDTWIHRIAVNAALQLLRKHRPGIFEPLETEPVDHSSSPESARQNDEIDRQLSAALTSLTDLERVCFLLKHLEQWRLTEIAAELDVGISTVKQALFRGVRKLRGRAAGLKGELE